MRLEQKVAIVTGGGTGIGEAIAKVFAREGAKVAITGRRKGELERVVREIGGKGGQALALPGSVTIEPDVQEAVAATVRTFGRLDILVNNAGWNIGIPFPELDKLTVEVWDRLQHTNLRGPFFLAKAAAPHMRAQGAGRIVNIASIAGHRPTGSSIGYATSKAALVHLTRCLAVALAPAITVNCVSPGLIEGTRMAQRIPPAVAESVRKSVVLGRGADVKDIAAQVETFCRADSVTGQVLVVDGGLVFH